MLSSGCWMERLSVGGVEAGIGAENATLWCATSDYEDQIDRRRDVAGVVGGERFGGTSLCTGHDFSRAARKVTDAVLYVL